MFGKRSKVKQSRTRKSRHQYQATRRKRLLLETLESRRLLAVVNWDGEGDGTSFLDPLNWDTDSGSHRGRRRDHQRRRIGSNHQRCRQRQCQQLGNRRSNYVQRRSFYRKHDGPGERTSNDQRRDDRRS